MKSALTIAGRVGRAFAVGLLALAMAAMLAPAFGLSAAFADEEATPLTQISGEPVGPDTQDQIIELEDGATYAFFRGVGVMSSVVYTKDWRPIKYLTGISMANSTDAWKGVINAADGDDLSTCLWKCTKDANGRFHFDNNGKYLKSSGSNRYDLETTTNYDESTAYQVKAGVTNKGVPTSYFIYDENDYYCIGTDTNDKFYSEGTPVFIMKVCLHPSKTLVSAKTPSCGDEGYVAHYECTDCGAYFAADDATQRITNIKAEHDFSTLASSTENDFTLSCSNGCGATKVVAKADCTHNYLAPKHYNRVGPACTAPGHVEYWECVTCGKRFADEGCTTQLDSILDEHNLMYTRVQPATCTEAGGDLYACVYGCGTTELRNRDNYPALGHSFPDRRDVEASLIDPETKTATVTCLRDGCEETTTLDMNFDVWDGTIATEYAGGTGTESDPYLISSGAQLAYLAQQANASEENTSDKHFKLTCDIYLDGHTWTPIGTYSGKRFAGSFDGNGHTIDFGDMTVSSGNFGLFGHAGHANISNLITAGNLKVSSSSSRNFSALVCRVDGDLNIINCGNDASIIQSVGANVGTYKHEGNAGGLVGIATTVSGEKPTLRITNSYNRGNITVGYGAVGGIVGCQQQNIYLVVEKCYNRGAITSDGNFVGGIVGYATYASNNSCDGEVRLCYNAAVVHTAYAGGGTDASGTTVPKYAAPMVGGVEKNPSYMQVAASAYDGDAEYMGDNSPSSGIEASGLKAMSTADLKEDTVNGGFVLDKGGSAEKLVEVNDGFPILDWQYKYERTAVAVPTAAQGLVYNGQSQTGVQNTDQYYVVSNAAAKNAGTYTAVVALRDTKLYVWEDGTVDNKEVEWTIRKSPRTAFTVDPSISCEVSIDGDGVDLSKVFTGGSDEADAVYNISNDGMGRARLDGTILRGSYPGTVTVTAYKPETANYYELTSEQVTFTIQGSSSSEGQGKAYSNINSASDVTVNTSGDELIAALMTEEDASLVAGSTYVYYDLDVATGADCVSDEAKAGLKSAAGGFTAGMYLNASVKKETVKFEIGYPVVTDTTVAHALKNIGYAVKLSAAMINTNAAFTRSYSVVAQYVDAEGTVAYKTIAPTYNATAKTLSFESDCLGGFALCYKDTSNALANGATFKAGAKNMTYKVTCSVAGKYAVSLINGKPAAGAVSIPATVTYKGVTYSVTSLAAGAFKGNKKLTKITFAAKTSIATIPARTFMGCSKLKTVVVPSTVKSIKLRAFANCGKLKKVTIKSKKLTKAGVKKSLKGSKVTVVKVALGTKAANKKFVKKYKKFFTKANCGKKVTVK